jgi:ATP-binding cassette subfamily B protein
LVLLAQLAKISYRKAMNLSKSPFLYYVRKFPRAFILGMFLLVITNIMDALWPLLLKVAIDQVQAQVSFNELTKTVLFYFAILFCLAWTRYGWRSVYGGFHTWAQEDIRQDLFAHLMSLGMRFFQKNPVGEVLSTLTNDVQAFRQGLGPGILMLADAIIIICSVIPAMLYLNTGWTFKVLVFVPLIPFLIWKVMKLIHYQFKMQQEKFSELTGICQETIGGIRVIKGFAQEHNRLQVFNKTSSDFEEITNKMAFVDSLFVPVMELGVASGSIILIFIAKGDVLSGVATIGTFVAFHRYIAKMIWPMTALGLGFSYVQKGRASYDRIQEVLLQRSEIKDEGDQELRTFTSLEFKNVSFHYPDSDRLILNDVSFAVISPEFLGITGPVGSGKSTLLHLILRLYPVSSGEILINGVNIEKYTLESLRRTMILVPSEPFLFSDSIRENILFGVQQDTEHIHKLDDILNSVCLQEEIAGLPHKSESQLGERGVNLSGGQKQRVTLARGLILQGEIILLDDIMSAVDTKTEARIEKALYESKKTRILISHRLKALQSADRILVLNEGRVEAIGTQAELLIKSESFKKIFEIQADEVLTKSSSNTDRSRIEEVQL